MLVGAWQIFEHNRSTESAESALLNRARDISNSVGIVIRSQGRFGFVSQPRLEAALEELTKSGELKSVVLVNSAYEVAASAGEPIDLDIEDLSAKSVQWTGQRVTYMNLVDLGPPDEDGSESRAATIVMPPSDSGRDPVRPDRGAPLIVKLASRSQQPSQILRQRRLKP